MDLLSATLLSIRMPLLAVVECSFAGEWGLVCDDLQLPYAVVLLDGACWTSSGAGPWMPMQTGEAQLMLRQEAVRWASGPTHPVRSVSRRAAELGYALAPATKVLRGPWRMRFGDSDGNGNGDGGGSAAGRFIVLVFDEPAGGAALLERLPATMALAGPMAAPAKVAQPALARLLDADLATGFGAVAQGQAQSLFVGLLREWVSATRSAPPGGVDAWLDARFAPAVAEMRLRPAHRWRLDDLAALAGMSRSAFARDFPLTFGCTPMRYLADLRLQQALELLDTTAWPLERIADEVGLGGARRLRVGVLRHTGLMPTAWRERHRRR